MFDSVFKSKLCLVFRQMQKLWSNDPFLQSGGHLKSSRRKVEGFHYAFTVLHARGKDPKSEF
jgi:hypothetical protein